jgi:hypothetical protein
MGIVINRVETKKDRKRFVKFLWKVYKGNPYWVPPLIVDRLSMIDKEKHPFYKDAEMEMFLAEKDGELVGRIAAIVNHNHNKFHNDKVGFFGFYECMDDQEVSNKLFDTAKDWLKEKGMDVMRGPMNPSTNYEIGLLINAFDQSPVIMMTYNPEYYIKLIENYGFVKAKDLYAYRLTYEKTMSDKLKRVSDIVRTRKNFKIRSANMKDFDNEVKRIKEVYNDAWSPNWGFVPFTEAEFDHIAKDLKMIVFPDLILIGELAGKPVGFSISLPDMNQIFKTIPNGKLFPTGIFKLLFNKKKINGVRIIILGIKKEHQRIGLDSVFYYETWYRSYVNHNIRLGEASWILEDNVMMNRSAELMNSELYKKYRVYDYNLS